MLLCAIQQTTPFQSMLTLKQMDAFNIKGVVMQDYDQPWVGLYHFKAHIFVVHYWKTSFDQKTDGKFGIDIFTFPRKTYFVLTDHSNSRKT